MTAIQIDTTPRPTSSLRHWLVRLLGERRGVATLELALSLPILTVVLLGSVEYVLYAWANGRVADATATIGDLVTQNDAVDETQVAAIVRAADLVISGARTSGGESAIVARVTSAISCRCDDRSEELCFFTLWSHRYEKGRLSPGFDRGERLRKVPEGVAVAENESLVIAETDYTFREGRSFILPRRLYDMSETRFFRPRKAPAVRHDGDQAPSRAVTCANIDEVFGS